MKQFVFWCSLLLGLAVFNNKVLCRPSDPSPELDYIGDEEGDDYEEYDDKPYSGPPPVMHSKNDTITAKVGETVKLPCVVENGDNFVLLWLNFTTPNAPTGMFMDSIRQVGKADRVFRLPDKSIEIQHLTPTDSGVYSCKLMTEPPLVTSYKLIVQSPLPPNTKPSITVFKPSKEINIRKGEPLSLRCEAQGNPQPKITWTKNDNKNNELKMQEDGTLLTIDSVSRRNSGIYTCNAQNNIASDTRSITVHVHYAPEIELEEDIVMTGEDVSVNLICTVHATPRPKVTWLKDGKPLPVSSNMINEKNKYTLQLSNVKQSDFGEYTCEASNKEGPSEKSKTLSGKPKKPTLEKTEDASKSKKPQMDWKIQSFAPPVEYELKYKSKEDQEWKTVRKNLDNEQKNAFVYSIKHGFDNIPSGEYQTQMKVKNRFGWSDMSDVHFFTKDEEGELTESSLLDNNSTTMKTLQENNNNVSTVTEKVSLGQQLFNILSSSKVNEDAINGLAKSQNFSNRLDKQGLDLLAKTFKIVLLKFNESEQVENEMAKVFVHMLNTTNDEKSEPLNKGKYSNITTSTVMISSIAESASLASELRISAVVVVTCLFVARLYC